MPVVGAWCKIWIYFGFVFGWSKAARPRFDSSTDMNLVLIPADAEVDSVIFRLRATDQDADFPLVFEITATITPVVRIENLPCTLYNKVCQANVILTKRLIPGRLHDFAVRVRDTKGDSNSMQATISVTNATTQRDKIFPHIPSLIMVPEDTKPGKELDYLLVRANSWSGKPVYIELWQPKELFTIRQRQTPTQTRGIITLIGELDFETQSMYTLTMYATDPYTEPGKDTRNIAGLNVVVVVQDVQDVPPIFTLAPPLTRINNSMQPGDVILRVHAEDGDKGVPREIAYGLVSEGNPFTPFFNISETTGEITLARPLEELTQITHVGAPVVLTVVAEEIRRSKEEPPVQATVVEVGFLLGEPGNSPPYFESENYVATVDENLEPGTVIMFGEQFSTRVRDEDIGKAGVFALKLENNNGTFEINPTVAERTADFIITVRDNTLIDYDLYKSLSFKITAQEVGPATNLSASAPVVIFLRDVNDNPPVFDEESYEVTLSENVTAGTRVVQVHATDKDTGSFGNIRYTGITGEGSDAFVMDSDTGLITVAMGSSLDREIAPKLLLSVEARDEDGKGNRGTVPLIVNLLDVNDNAPLFDKEVYEFTLNSELTNFTTPAVIKAIDADAEPPNNEVRYELIHGNYENKFQLDEITGELFLRSPVTKVRRKKQSEQFAKKFGTGKLWGRTELQKITPNVATILSATLKPAKDKENETDIVTDVQETTIRRRKRADDDALYTLTARAYDLGVPHLSSVTQIRILSGVVGMEARIVMFVVPGEHPDLAKTTETLSTITGGRITVLETRPYVAKNQSDPTHHLPGGSKKSIVVARVEQTESGTALVDIEKIRDYLAANGVGIINGSDAMTHVVPGNVDPKTVIGGDTADNGQTTNINSTIIGVHNEEVTVYKAENKLLIWLLVILALLMLIAIAVLIICCICPGCPFYMAPRKRRVHSSETLIVRDGRPKRHLQRKPAAAVVETAWNGRKQAWSADPTRRNWQFNRRNTKNCGLASLPGDVAYISGQTNDVQVNVESLRARDGPIYDSSRRIDEHERMYVDDMESQKMRGYDGPEMDSMRRHELERGSDAQRQDYRQRSDSRYVDAEMPEGTTVREQHFYREGNAEVLRLVTRGQVEDSSVSHHYHHRQPTTLIVDGKEILLRRFMEDQTSRHDHSLQELELARSMESHQRAQDALQQQHPPEVILIPERLDLDRMQHEEEIGPTVQRLVIDHGAYSSPRMEAKETQIRGTPRRLDRQERHDRPAEEPRILDRASVTKEHMQSTNVQPFSFHDLELARQNALLTRLLLEREGRHGIAGVADTTSYLETQSLPGQVAIATQTDRTTATQTDRHVRSRSDNDESDDDSKYRKKLKFKKRYGDGDWRRTRSLWMKSPIEEEDGPCFDKRLSILRRKVKEVKEGRKVPLEPEVLREISDSLEENGSSYPAEEEEATRTYQRSTEQTSIKYKVLNEEENESRSSMEMDVDDNYERIFGEKTVDRRRGDRKADVTESTSSPETRGHREAPGRGKSDGKSPKKEGRTRAQRKFDGVMKPTFRILEREITMLTKKLSKMGDKKPPESSDSTSQDKPSSSKDSKNDTDEPSFRKIDTSSSRAHAQSSSVPSTSKSPSREQTDSQRKEAAITKTRQKLKYQQSQVMSTGSSEYDDSFEKATKQSPEKIQDSKHKQAVSQAKTRRPTHPDHREGKKQSSSEQESAEKRKEKPGRIVRAPKLASIARKENVIEEQSVTSASSEKTAGKKVARRDSEKRETTESSSGNNGSDEAKRAETGEQVSEQFSDHFVKEPRRLRQSTVMAARAEKRKRREAADLEKFAEDKLGDEMVQKSEERRLRDEPSPGRVTEQSVEAKKIDSAAMASDGVRQDEGVSVVTESIQAKREKPEMKLSAVVPESDHTSGEKISEMLEEDKTETEAQEDMREGEEALEDSTEKYKETIKAAGETLIASDTSVIKNGEGEAEASTRDTVTPESILDDVGVQMDKVKEEYKDMDASSSDIKDEDKSDPVYTAPDTKKEEESVELWREESNEELKKEELIEPPKKKKHDMPEQFEQVQEPRVSIEAKTEEEEGRITEEEGKDSKIEQEGTEGLSIQDLSTKDIKVEDLTSPEQTKGDVSTQIDKKKEMFSEASVTQTKEEKLGSPETEEASQIVKLEKDASELHEKEQTTETTTLEKEKFEFREKDEASEIAQLEREGAESPETEEPSQIEKLEKETLESHQKEEISETVHLETKQAEPSKVEKANQIAKLEKKELELPEKESVSKTSQLEREKTESPKKNEVEQIAKLEKEELESPEKEELSKIAQLETEEIESPQKQEAHPTVKLEKEQLEPREPNEISQTVHLDRKQTKSPEKEEVDQTAKLENEELESPEREELSKIAHLEREETRSPEKEELDQTAKLDKEKLESREQEEITETTHLAKEQPQSSDNEETNQITKLKNEELESREEENGSQSAKLETLKSPEKKKDEMFLDASSKQVESLVPEEHEQIHKLSPAAEEATKEKDFKKDALNGKQEEDFAIPEIREPIAKDNQLLGTEKDIVIVKPDEHSTVDKEAVATAQLDSAQVHLTPTRFGSVRDKEPDKEDTLEEKEQDSVDRTESQILDVVGLSEKEKEKQLIVSKDEEREAKDLTPEGGEPVKKEATESEKHTKKEEAESGINKEEARTEEREELIISDDDKKAPTVEESEEYQKKGEKETPVIKDTTKQDAASDVEAKELIKEPKEGKEKCESEVDVTEKEDVPKVGIVKQEDDAVKTSVLLDVTKKEPSIQEVTKDEPEDSKTGDESKVDVIKKEDQAVATAITPGVTEEKPLVEELKKDELESSKTEDERNISLPIDERIVKKSSNFLDDSQTSVTHVDEPSRVQQLTVTDSEEGNIIEDSTTTAETKIPESVPIGADDDEALRDKFSKAMPEITPQGNVKAEEKIDSTEELSVPQETKSDELAKEATEKPQEIETHKTEVADKVTVSKEAGKDESATDKSVDTETPSKDEEISKELEWHHDFVKDSTRLMIESERAHMKEVDSFFKQQVDSLSKEIPDKPKKCDESAEPVAEIQQEHKLPGSSDVQESVKDKILKEDEGCEKAVIKSVEDVTVEESPITAELAKSVSTKDEEQKFESTAPRKEAVQETVTISESKVQSEPKDKQNETQIAGQFTDQRVVLTDEDTSHRPVDEKFLSDPNSRQILPDESTLSIEETVEGKTRIQERLKDKRDELSVPLFSTNIIDTLDDSDESDSSSDISRKTTLTTGPYQTPRHRSKSSSGAELVESMGEKAEVQSLHSEEETWAVELDESTTRELPENRGEREKEDDKDEENTKMKEINLEKHTVDSKTGGSVDNLHSVSLQPKKPVKTSPKGKLEASKHDKSSRPTVGRSGTTRNGKEFKSDSIAKEKRDEPRGIKAEAGKSVSNTKKQDEKGESSKTGTKPKQPEKLRSQRRKKGNSTDETSDEKSTHPKERGQRRAQPPSTSDRSGPQEIDQVKRRSSDQARESKKAEKPQEKLKRKESLTRPKEKASSGSEKSSSPPKTGDIDTSKAQPKYMAWYKKKREEMERRRAEVKEDEEQLPRWLRKGRKSKSDKTEKQKEQKTPETTPRTRRKVKPLVNVESEQLKAIVRQGRKLRRAEGGGNEDPPVQIFATTPPAAPDPKHHLLQHSQYKYEKIQPPFYLHPPPAPHSSPQLSPQHFEAEPRETTEHRHLEDQFDPGIGIPIQTTGRLRHQQLLEKKSVFDIAYSEAAPPQLRSDSTTPPS